MGRKKTISESDKSLFREAVKDCKPLKDQGSRVYPKKHPSSAKPHKTPEAPYESPYTRSIVPDVSPEAVLSYHQDGVSPKMLKYLRTGSYDIASNLDLHGETISSAEKQLDQWLAYCIDRQFRHVRLIHGKGYNSQNTTLKSYVAAWLEEDRRIIAFHSCQPRDGGTGAMYILLSSQ